jgi:hypothetical protein
MIYRFLDGRPMVAPTLKNMILCRGEEIACNLVAACRLPLGRPFFHYAKITVSLSF